MKIFNFLLLSVFSFGIFLPSVHASYKGLHGKAAKKLLLEDRAKKAQVDQLVKDNDQLRLRKSPGGQPGGGWDKKSIAILLTTLAAARYTMTQDTTSLNQEIAQLKGKITQLNQEKEALFNENKLLIQEIEELEAHIIKLEESIKAQDNASVDAITQEQAILDRDCNNLMKLKQQLEANNKKAQIIATEARQASQKIGAASGAATPSEEEGI